MERTSIKKFLLENERINSFCACLYRFLGRNSVKRGHNVVGFNNTYLNHCSIRISGHANEIIFRGTNYFKGCRFFITGNNNRIIIGDKVCGYDATFIIEDCNGTIEIGNKTLFAGKIEVACTEGKTISIGDGCLFSSDVDIRNGDSHSIFDINGNRTNSAENIVIGNDGWVAHRAMILKGAVVQDHSVVGAGTVLTKSFNQSNVVIAGVPGKIVRENIYWKHNR